MLQEGDEQAILQPLNGTQCQLADCEIHRGGSLGGYKTRFSLLIGLSAHKLFSINASQRYLKF
jgi:hypothetical protein